MEPICYFISTGYGLLFYLFFFLRTRRDPTARSMFEHMFLKSVARRHMKTAPVEAWSVTHLLFLPCFATSSNFNVTTAGRI